MPNHSQEESAPNKDSILKSESAKFDESSSKSEPSSSSHLQKLQSETSDDLLSSSTNHKLIRHSKKNAWEIKDGDKSYLLTGIEINVKGKVEKGKTKNRNLTNPDDELHRQAEEYPRSGHIAEDTPGTVSHFEFPPSQTTK